MESSHVTIDRRNEPWSKSRFKPHRQFDWVEVLGDTGHLATSVAERLGMNLPNARRHLRWAVHVEKVVIVKKGRLKYYLAKETWEKWKNQKEEP